MCRPYGSGGDKIWQGSLESLENRIDYEWMNARFNEVFSIFPRASFIYEGTMIVSGGQGTDYEEFKSQCKGKAFNL